jgi:hypothetical protein
MRSIGRVVLAVGAIVWLTAAVAQAQTQLSTTETKKFEVIAVEGNTLVVRLPEGTRELTVPDDFRFTINGKPMSVHELKPGMAGTATITTKTTTTPVTVTEVKNGTVAQVTGSSIIVRTDEGYRSFTQGDLDKRGVKIYRSGKLAQLTDLRTGDRLSATIVTTKPPRVVTEKEVQANLASSAPPASAAAAKAPGSAGVGTAASSPASAAPGGAPSASAKKLPSTAGSVPLAGLVGLLSLAIGAALTVLRRRLMP